MGELGANAILRRAFWGESNILPKISEICRKRGLRFCENRLKCGCRLGGGVSRFSSVGSFAGLAELADAMDSKSIARKGVPVRLRDPVLGLDKTLVLLRLFLFLAIPRRDFRRRTGGRLKIGRRRGRRRAELFPVEEIFKKMRKRGLRDRFFAV